MWRTWRKRVESVFMTGIRTAERAWMAGAAAEAGELGGTFDVAWRPRLGLLVTIHAIGRSLRISPRARDQVAAGSIVDSAEGSIADRRLPITK
jgi:hypothetical protein